MFLFVAAFVDRNTEREKTIPMAMVHSRYREILDDFTKGVDSNHGAGMMWAVWKLKLRSWNKNW